MIELTIIALVVANIALSIIVVVHARGEAARFARFSEKALTLMKPEAAQVSESIKQHREVFDLEKEAYAKSLKIKAEPKKNEPNVIVDQETGHKIEVLDIM